jgi:excisionase family DNA binding protein
MRLPIDAVAVPTGVDSALSESPMLLTVEEAARLLRIGRTTTYELVMRGRIQSVKVGRRRLVVRQGLNRYVAELLASQSDY